MERRVCRRSSPSNTRVRGFSVSSIFGSRTRFASSFFRISTGVGSLDLVPTDPILVTEERLPRVLRFIVVLRVFPLPIGDFNFCAHWVKLLPLLGVLAEEGEGFTGGEVVSLAAAVLREGLTKVVEEEECVSPVSSSVEASRVALEEG